MSYARSHQSEAVSTVEDGTRSSSKIPTGDEWDEKKATLRYLYITKKLPLTEVMSYMERNHQFKASKRMYKSRLANWGYQKNISHRDWQAVAILLRQREEEGKRTASLEINGRSKTLREYRRHVTTCHMSEKQFLRAALEDCVTVPDSIRAVPPETGEAKIPSNESSGEPSTSTGPSFTAGLVSCTPTSSSMKSGVSNGPQRSQNSAPFVHFDAFNEVKSSFEPPAAPTTSLLAAEMPDLLAHETFSAETVNSLPDPVSFAKNQRQCDHVQQDIGLMLAQAYRPDAMTAFPDVRDLDSWVLVSKPDPMAEERMCPKCQSPTRKHQPLPPDWVLNPSPELPQMISYQTLDPRVQVSQGTDEASVYQACCFAACMYGGQEKFDLLSKSLHQADQVFQKMLSENNPMALLSVLLTLTILHAHDQGSMAASIIRSAHHVSCHLLGEGNPISLSIEWLTAAAGKKLSQCRIKTATLRAVYKNMEQKFGEYHQHTIVALYCLSFNLILDKAFVEAERKFTYMYEICKNTLGPSHIQTISCLNGLSRVQSRLEKFDEAISSLQKSLSKHPLGPNHPYRLETMRRLAILYKNIGKKDLMERIYWAVLRGRIKTLGKTHSFTEAARVDLERLLKELGKWDDQGLMESRVQKLFEDGTALTSDFESF